MGTHKRLLFEIIREAGEITSKELYEEYEQRIGDSMTKRTRRRYLRRLETYYALISSEGETRGRRYELQG